MVRSLALAAALMALSPEYEAGIQAWRADREARLKAQDGWLSLSGLFWLNEGENSVGARPGCRIQLPDGLPANAGVLVRNGSVVTFRSPDSGGVNVNGKPAPRTLELRPDRSGSPDVLEIGRVRLYIIERGTKLGVRMKDPQSEARTHFTGLSWFPVREDWRVEAAFVPRPRQLVFDAQAGDRQEYESPGYVEWKRNGVTLRLTPVLEEDQFFFVFRDTTAGKSTYPAARFLYADPPKNGKVVLDFNKAYNPPCMFTPYATCPLPPPENRLAVPVEAGEKMYTGHR